MIVALIGAIVKLIMEFLVKLYIISQNINNQNEAYPLIAEKITYWRHIPILHMVIIAQNVWERKGLFFSKAKHWLVDRLTAWVVQFLLQVAQLVKLFHGGDEKLTGLVAVLWANHANFFEPDGETRNKAVAFAEIGLQHSGAKFAFG